MNILEVDQNLLVAINSLLVGRSDIGDTLVKGVAVYLVYLLPVVLVFMWFKFPARRKEVFLSFFAAVLAWLVITKTIVPAIWFRPRPDLASIGIKELLFHRPDYSFPSDHATVLFALAIGLGFFGWRKAGNYFMAGAVAITVCRVAIGVHFPLDIIAGCVSGSLGVLITFSIREYVVKFVYNPIVKLLQKVRLA